MIEKGGRRVRRNPHMSVGDFISQFKRQVRQLHRRSFSDPGRATPLESNVLFNRTRSEVYLAELPVYNISTKKMAYINYLTNNGPIPKFIPDPAKQINAHVWTISNEDKGIWIQQKVSNPPVLTDQIKEDKCPTSHWQRFSLHEKTFTMKKAILWKNQVTDKGIQQIFLHEEIFRNLMTYHEVKDGTIILKKELVPAMWEHRVEGGREELTNVTVEEVNEVFAAGMDVNNQEPEGAKACIGQEDPNTSSIEEKEIELQRKIITRNQKNAVSREVKEAYQTKSLDHKVMTLEKKLTELNKNLRKAKNDAQSSQNEYLKEHADKTEAQERVKTLDKDNKAVYKKLENKNRDIEELQHQIQEKMIITQELEQELQETRTREEELKIGIDDATSEAQQRQAQVQSLEDSLIRVKGELQSANGEDGSQQRETLENMKSRIVELEQELVNQVAEHRRIVESIHKNNDDVRKNQLAALNRTELERKVLSAQMEVMRRDIPGENENLVRHEMEDAKKKIEAQTQENENLKE